MANIDNLKNKILDDDKIASEEILNEGKQKAKSIIDEAKRKSDEIMSDMKEKAEKDGREQKERMISRAKLEVRNDILRAKQGSIDLVLNKTLENISNMNDEEYIEFIKKLLLNSVETGSEEIIFSTRDKNRIKDSAIAEVNTELKNRGLKGELKISSETRDISSGFILKRGGLELNCSIDSQIRILRDSLEGEIANLLFEGI